MDQAGLLLMLTQHKLLPSIMTRNEACALYKAVTRGSPLHQRHGMLFADFRECIRRIGAWKGFKLWGLSKADLTAIHDANSANQQRDAVVRELKLVKELAAASQIAAKHNAASSGSGGMSDFVGMSDSPLNHEAKRRLEEELRLATTHAHELAERNKV